MDDRDRRLAISLRLKAARFLAGYRSKNRAVALTVRELADRPVIRENGITKNRLDEIEQMSVTARPMELEKIAEALGVPATWFQIVENAAATDVQTVQRLTPGLLAAVQALRQEQGPPLRDAGAPGRQAGSSEATDG